MSLPLRLQQKRSRGSPAHLQRSESQNLTVPGWRKSQEYPYRRCAETGLGRKHFDSAEHTRKIHVRARTSEPFLPELVWLGHRTTAGGSENLRWSPREHTQRCNW